MDARLMGGCVVGVTIAGGRMVGTVRSRSARWIDIDVR
jgi:hypothetical protein